MLTKSTTPMWLKEQIERDAGVRKLGFFSGFLFFCGFMGVYHQTQNMTALDKVSVWPLLILMLSLLVWLAKKYWQHKMSISE